MPGRLWRARSTVPIDTPASFAISGIPLCFLGVLILLLHFERNRIEIDGVGADHDLECARLDDPFHLAVVEPQCIRSDLEGNGACLSPLDRYALESFQFFYWTSDRTDFIPDVQLHYLIASPAAGVGHIDRYLRGSGHGNRAWLNAQVAVVEFCVAEAVAKG